MWVKFDSDSKTASSGFNATFKAVRGSPIVINRLAGKLAKQNGTDRMGTKMGWSPIVYLAFALTFLSSVEGQCSSSGTTLTGSSGSFSSPNYPSNYPNSETCRWIITVPQGHLVRLSFESFQLESCALPSPVCSCDHVEVRDGTVASSERLGIYCGNEYPAAVQSSGRSMWIEFDSDLFSNEKGFNATYTAVAASECPKNGIVSGVNGSITSPGFPLTYPVSVKCTWIIEVPEDYQVQLTFPTFQLENCAISSLCSCDHVQVRNGRDENSEELKEFCGDNIPATQLLRSKGRYMWVEFDSDSKTVGNGFDVFFKAVREFVSHCKAWFGLNVGQDSVDQSPVITETDTMGYTPVVYLAFALTLFSSVRGQCSSSGITLIGTSGSFSSPNYPSNYANRQTCTWIITVPQGHLVRLSFESFQLESCALPSPVCSCDHLEVRDGSVASSERLGRYCGDEYPAAVQSSGRFMWIEFCTDLFSNEKGFFATYTAVDSSECPTNGVLRDENGSFTSPGFPSGYPGSVRCSWIIEVPENHKVELTFDTFQLASCAVSLSCSCGHVEVRDGRSAGSEKLKTICGDEKPPAIRSSERYLWVEFGSDWRKTSKGFYASFKAVRENVFYCDTWTGWSVGKGPCTGITAGVVLVVVVMFALGYWCYRKSRILSVV
ncbi:hypothetical protein ACROYT_G007676 [Oculina patagonica]